MNVSGTQHLRTALRGGGREKSPSRRGCLPFFLILLLIAVGATLGILFFTRGDAVSGRSEAELAAAVADAKKEWMRLYQSGAASTPEGEAELAAARDLWKDAESACFDRINELRREWSEISDDPRGDRRKLAALEERLRVLGAGPEPNETIPPLKYRDSRDYTLRARHLDYSAAKYGELDFPARDRRRASSSRGATTGILVDLTSGKVLWAKNPDKAVPIASMVKMMTVLVTLEELETRSDIDLSTRVQITGAVNTIPKDGVIYLDTRESFPLEHLLQAIVIKSANDAAVQIAEFIGGGDQQAFVARMNDRARSLGMKNTRYTSPCGLPVKGREDSVSSPADLVILAEELLHYPKVMEFAGIQHIQIPRPLPPGKIDLSTTNKLVNPRWEGVDGLKTGFTNAAGSCLTVTCLRNGRRLVGVVTGFGSAGDRDRFCRALLDWGYARAAELEKNAAAPAAK